MKRYNKSKKSRKSSRIANRIVNFSPGDYVLAGVVLVLTIFGVVMVYNTGLVVAFEQFGDKYWFFKNQSLWAVLGIIGGFIVSNLNHEVWKRLGVWLFVISVIMLLLVLIPGFSPQVYGAKQRLVIPGVPFLDRLSIQPSELVKLSLIIYLSALFVKEKAEKKAFPYMQFLVVLGVVAGLTAVEPDLGNAILITSSALVVFFAAGANVFVFMGILAVGLVSALLYALSSEYRRQRILTFLNPLSGTSSVSYHITQIFIALGSGGFLGLGLGNSRQKYQYIPEVTTDSIFAIIGEELGFVGAVLVIAALVFIIWRGFKIASECKDEFGRLLALGVTANIGFQAIVNLGGMVGIMPFTGVPLPFISYGGTSLTLLLISVGILLSISRSNNLNKR
ncbi:putative lipid II flippase FtsW [candidate division WWE3 bacterium]|uniref:Probable peptidoglycan glycosyltransferase FtsW n=1 Tax=candidate division WWE3 bacterium TaxID=2053526 RepID=A0A955RQX8_UNCKA|nr:putative lipid II flippase FtsW [candidate division WWE3 bacterium]